MEEKKEPEQLEVDAALMDGWVEEGMVEEEMEEEVVEEVVEEGETVISAFEEGHTDEVNNENHSNETTEKHHHLPLHHGCRCHCICPPRIRVCKLVNKACVKAGGEIRFRIIVQNCGCCCYRIVVKDKLTDMVEVNNSLMMNGRKIDGSVCRGYCCCIRPCETICFEFAAKLKAHCHAKCVSNCAEVRVEIPCFCTHILKSNVVRVKVIARPKPRPKPCYCCHCCCCCYCCHHHHK